MPVMGEEPEDALTIEELAGLGPVYDDDANGEGPEGSGEQTDGPDHQQRQGPRRVEVDRDTVNFDRLISWGRRQDPVRITLLVMCVAWAIVFIALGTIRHNRFSTFSFDLGIYDHAVWLLSRLRGHDTVKGVQVFGYHVNLILIAFVPFYWLGAGPLFLLVVQVLAQASGAVAIYLLARDRFQALAPSPAGLNGLPGEDSRSASDGDRWLAVGLAAVLLLNPTYQYLTWEYFHPDALAISPLLFAYWAAAAKRWRWFVVAAVLAVACKEDVALPMAVIGTLIYLRSNRRIGLNTIAASAGWFLLSKRAIMPAFLGGSKPLYEGYFTDFGTSTGEIVRNVISRPGKTLDLVTAKDRVNYYRMMLTPVAFVPFASAGTMMIALPLLAVNALSSFPYAREIRYHYAALVLAGIILATVEGVARMGAKPGFRRFLVGLIAATSLASSVAWGPSPISTKYRDGLWPLAEDARHAVMRSAVRIVPSGESVAATYQFVPHLSHRPEIYDFPKPWDPTNTGLEGETARDPMTVKWLVLDRQLLDDDDKNLVDSLLAGGEFEARLDRSDVLVAERTQPADP